MRLFHLCLEQQPPGALEHLTKPSDLIEADEGAAEGNECLVDVGAALVADRQAAEAIEPSQRSLNDPAVPARPFAAVQTTLRDAGV